jgi:glycosyltransferase involved in cell wall biosynthesis
MVAVGRLVWAKGYEDLVDAFQLVADETPEVYCIIAGDGELAPIIRAKIEAAGLSDRIILLGHVSRDDVLSLMTWCNIFVMSSRSEGTPMVILEAASLKKPILATKVGGIPDMLSDEEECLLVPAGNPPALAKGMKRLLSDSQFSERLAQAAYFRVIRDFSVISQAESMISVYKDAWQERKLV